MWRVVALLSILCAFSAVNTQTVALATCGRCQVYTWSTTNTYVNSTCSFVTNGYPLYSRCSGCCSDNYYYYPVPRRMYDYSYGCKPTCAKKKRTTLVCTRSGSTYYSTYEYDYIAACACTRCSTYTSFLSYNYLYATADDYMHLYIDGVYHPMAPSGWNTLKTYPVPKCARCLVVRFWDAHDVVTGFIARGVGTGTLPSRASTPGSWKCSKTFVSGWHNCSATSSLGLYSYKSNGDSPWSNYISALGTSRWINPGSYYNVAPAGNGPYTFCWVTL